jgi:ABC-type glycerol-3-phosphate transport system substrate-binding protein
LNKAKVGAMSLVLVLGLASCGSASTEATTDSTAVVVDTTTTQVVDTLQTPSAEVVEVK